MQSGNGLTEGELATLAFPIDRWLVYVAHYSCLGRAFERKIFETGYALSGGRYITTYSCAKTRL
ncbi:hypothetical protein BCAR13_1470018 [Paraburkholderia caribensis]|nr:hypothetical protein BCAR13_1470018 [Paraburkholderia caribensis]